MKTETEIRAHLAQARKDLDDCTKRADICRAALDSGDMEAIRESIFWRGIPVTKAEDQLHGTIAALKFVLGQ